MNNTKIVISNRSVALKKERVEFSVCALGNDTSFKLAWFYGGRQTSLINNNLIEKCVYFYCISLTFTEAS